LQFIFKGLSTLSGNSTSRKRENSLAEDGALRLLVMLKLALKDITHLRSVTGMAGAKARQRAASASLGPAAVSEWQPGSPRCLGFEPW